MIRHIALAATLAAILATAACADSTAPGNGFCQITSGSNNCT
jgi:hypothetical protein